VLRELSDQSYRLEISARIKAVSQSEDEIRDAWRTVLGGVTSSEPGENAGLAISEIVW
jgi:hypothetical protein